MNRPTRRLLGILPLIAALGLVGVWISGNAPSRERETKESAIRLRWEAAADAPSLVKEIEAYLTRFGDDRAAVWFVVEAYGHLRDIPGALAAFHSRPALRDEPGAARHLARLLLDPLRTVRGTPEVKTVLWPRILHILLEAGDEEAERVWAETAKRMAPLDVMSVFVPSQRTPSRGTEVIASALAARKDVRELHAAGAILLAGPKHLDDVPFLLDAFHSAWRQERRPTWTNIVRALGATGDPRAIAALRADDPASPDATALPTRSTLDMGLALADDADARERLLTDPLARQQLWIIGLYGVGLAVRLTQGDALAIPRLVELWDRIPESALHGQLAQAVLVSDPLPPANFPAGRWADELAQSDTHVLRTLAHVWRYRTGTETAFASLSADLVAAARRVAIESPPTPDDADAAAVLEVLRAWLRFGGEGPTR